MKRTKRTLGQERKSVRTNHKNQADSAQLENFYDYRPWRDIWLDSFNFQQLEFWARIDDRNSMNLIVQLERAKYIECIGKDRVRPQFKPKASYYSDLKFYVVKQKNSAPSTGNPHPEIFSKPRFVKSCNRAWTSMRILCTFSVSQIKICSGISDSVAREFVYQMHQVNFIRLIEIYSARVFGSENIYQLIRNTGPIAPLPCANGIVYDINARSIYMTE